MIEKTTPHLRKLIKKSLAVKRQFIIPEKIKKSIRYNISADPLLEDEFMPIKGLVHKYQNRALVLLTLDCPSYCQFCTRQRSVGQVKNYRVTRDDIKNIINYLKRNPKINDIIFSGGDPFMAQDILKYSLKEISRLPQITIIRINTGVPVDDPKRISPELIKFLKTIKKPLYVGLHFEHSDELTPPTIKAIKALREAGCILYSQSVFLKGINDDYKALYNLFTRLTEQGVLPYYIYRCDYVKGAERFIVDFDKEIKIMTKLRKELSGLAYPLYVIDAYNGSGKVPVPLDFWDFDKRQFKDFNGKTIKIN